MESIQFNSIQFNSFLISRALHTSVTKFISILCLFFFVLFCSSRIDGFEIQRFGRCLVVVVVVVVL